MLSNHLLNAAAHGCTSNLFVDVHQGYTLLTHGHVENCVPLRLGEQNFDWSQTPPFAKLAEVEPQSSRTISKGGCQLPTFWATKHARAWSMDIYFSIHLRAIEIQDVSHEISHISWLSVVPLHMSEASSVNATSCCSFEANFGKLRPDDQMGIKLPWAGQSGAAARVTISYRNRSMTYLDQLIFIILALLNLF